jgi:hypothetical protein
VIHLVFSGRGWVAPAVVFASSLAMEAAVERYAGDDSYYQTHHWPLATALIAAGTIVWTLGVWWRTEPGRRLVDADTGEAVEIPPRRHTFFFIPLHWCGIVVMLIGALCAMPFMPVAGGT